MEVKLGVVYSPKELVIETDQAADEIIGRVDSALAGKAQVLWLSDTKGRRVGIPTEKLAYVEVGEEHPDRRGGFCFMGGEVVADLVAALVDHVVRPVEHRVGRVQGGRLVRVGLGVGPAERLEHLGRTGHASLLFSNGRWASAASCAGFPPR